LTANVVELALLFGTCAELMLLLKALVFCIVSFSCLINPFVISRILWSRFWKLKKNHFLMQNLIYFKNKKCST
jgi:hypothetical protein